MYAIRTRQLFDGRQLRTRETVLVVDGGRIRAVQSPASELPNGCEPIDFANGTLLPGLIDAHVHLCCDSGPNALERIPEASDQDMSRVIEASLTDQLSGGVTTVRDLGDRRYAVVDWRERNRHREGLPTVLASGPPITSLGGHCWNMGGEVAGSDALRAAVRDRAEHGVDIVKIMASGGANTPGSDTALPQFTPPEIQAVVAEAHSIGLQVTAHAHALNSIRAVIEAGVDCIEHCTFLTETGLDPDPDVIAAIATARIPVCPTLGFRPDAVIPPAIAELMRKTGLTAQGRAKTVAVMHRAGVKIVSGSDAGINPGKHHGVLREALIHLADAGVASNSVIASATSLGAEVLGLETSKGQLQPGFDADFLVVEGDPFAEITALRNVSAVFIGGVRVV